MHTENIGSTELIRAVVVAQLAKPAVEPSAAALLAKGFRYELLTWFGIVGGALTLFGNLSGVLKLADWARVLVDHWKEWTHAFWVWAFGWLGIHVPPYWSPVLSFLLFWALLTIGQRSNLKAQSQLNRLKINIKVRDFGGQCVIIFFWMYMVLCVLMVMYEGIEKSTAFGITLIILWSITLSIVIAVFARQRLHATISAVLFFGAFSFITLMPLTQLDVSSAQFGFSSVLVGPTVLLLAWFAPLILLSVAPAKAISRRLIFLALGLLLLIALNELSKLGLDVTAPKLQG